MYNYVIADRSARFRQGLIEVLASLGDFNCVAEVDNGDDVVMACGCGRLDFVLLDYALPEGQSTQLARYLTDKYAEMLVVGMSIDDSSIIRDRFVAAGAIFTSKEHLVRILPGALEVYRGYAAKSAAKKA